MGDTKATYDFAYIHLPFLACCTQKYLFPQESGLQINTPHSICHICVPISGINWSIQLGHKVRRTCFSHIRFTKVIPCDPQRHAFFLFCGFRNSIIVNLNLISQGHQSWNETSLMMTSSNGNIFRVTGHLCGEFTGPRWIPTQRPVTRSFDVFFDLHLNKRLSKQSRGWWFETPSHPLWRHRNVVCISSK